MSVSIHHESIMSCSKSRHEVKMAKTAGLEVVAAGWRHSVEPIQDSDDSNTCDDQCAGRSCTRGLWFVCSISCFIWLASMKGLVRIMETSVDITKGTVMAVLTTSWTQCHTQSLGNGLHSVLSTHQIRDILHWVYNFTPIGFLKVWLGLQKESRVLPCFS